MFLSNDNWSEYSLSYSEWKLINTSSNLLSHFCFAVKIFESEQVPTIHRVIERIYTLNEYLIEFIKKNLNNIIGTKFANELQLGLSRRFPKQGSQNKYRRIANYLAPQYKGLHITDLNKMNETKLDIKAIIDLRTKTTQTQSQEITASTTEDLSSLKRKFMAKKISTQTILSEECPTEK